MQQIFHQYFRPAEIELQKLWDEGLFSFDASVLLNVYGYSSETSEELISLLEIIAHRVRLPHQFGLEYCRNRAVVILKQVSNYNKVMQALEKIKSSDLDPKRDHPFLSPTSLKAFEEIKKELAESRDKMVHLVGSDSYAERILKIFAERVGPQSTEQRLAEIHTEAKDRYDKLIPPGFADLKEKGAPEAYGDYVGWVQLMDLAKTETKGFILITDDFKEDWWRIVHERTVAPRPELLAEFLQVTQMPFFMYTSESFLRAAKQYLKADIGDAVIEEVSQRLASQKLNQRPSEQKEPYAKAGSPSNISASPASPVKHSATDVVHFKEQDKQSELPGDNAKKEETD